MYGWAELLNLGVLSIFIVQSGDFCQILVNGVVIKCGVLQKSYIAET